MLRPLAVLLMAAYAARFFYPIFPSPYLEVFQRSDQPLYLNLARWPPLFIKNIRNEHEHRSAPGFSRMYLVALMHQELHGTSGPERPYGGVLPCFKKSSADEGAARQIRL